MTRKGRGGMMTCLLKEGLGDFDFGGDPTGHGRGGP